jgi:hypothetical protein
MGSFYTNTRVNQGGEILIDNHYKNSPDRSRVSSRCENAVMKIKDSSLWRLNRA